MVAAGEALRFVESGHVEILRVRRFLDAGYRNVGGRNRGKKLLRRSVELRRDYASLQPQAGSWRGWNLAPRVAIEWRWFWSRGRPWQSRWAGMFVHFVLVALDRLECRHVMK